MNKEDFQRAYNDINETIRWMGQTKDSVVYLQDTKDMYTRQLENNLLSIKNFNPAKAALREIEPEAIYTLREFAIKALEDTVEFDYEPFRTGFIKAMSDRRAIELVLEGKNSLRVKFNLNEVAGNIRDWGKAVTLTRKQLKISKYKKVPMSPEMASQMWKEKYYMPAREGTDIEHPSGRQVDVEAYIEKYRITMALRAQNMESLAPFWSIIDRGTRPLSSDWGGEGYPIIEPTNFLEDTVKEIKRGFIELYNSNVRYLNNAKESIEKLKELISYIEQEIRRLLEIIGDRINDEIFYDEGTKRTREDAFRDFTRGVLEKRLKARYLDADQAKVDLLTEMLMAGEELPQRFNIGYRGTQVRTRTLGLQRAAALYRQRSGK